jgi:hypothetical protein
MTGNTDPTMTTTIRTYAPTDADRVVEHSLAVWKPVFASFRKIHGDRLYRRVDPAWRTDEESSVRQALDSNETWVAVGDGVVTGVRQRGVRPARALR